jgi:hypothetical protein
MSKPLKILLGIAAAVAFVGMLTFMMLGTRRFRCEVCMSWNGRMQCKTASGETRDEAVNTARAQACALTASGMSDSRACNAADPAQIRWIGE